jgi:ATP-independent RNA helicase DbpA
MQDPKEVLIESAHTELDIEQRFYEVTNTSSKLPLLKALLLHYKPKSTLIFCNQRLHTTDLANALNQSGFHALALNGDMEQQDRDQVIVRFINRSCSILVATDVAARGIDIKELPAVINYDLAFDADVHIHRIGRTGRAGHKGLALTLTLPAEAPRVCLIEEQLSHPLTWDTIHSLDISDSFIPDPEMITLCIDAGRKDKIRPGDILGALTKDAGLPGDVIGKIDIAAICAYVAIHPSHADKAFRYFKEGKLKGRKVNVKKLR